MNSIRKKRLRPLAVVSGVRTPFVKAFGEFKDVTAVELGVVAVQEAVRLAGLDVNDVDEVVMGNVSGPADAANIARVIALQAGIPHDRPAHTVNRNCASGMESIISAWQSLNEGRADVIVAGGTESMSQVPLLWSQPMVEWLMNFRKARSIGQRLKLFTQLRPSFLKPIVALELGLTDPVCGLNMGETGEILAQEFHISRQRQDEFALMSHQRAASAWDRCFLGGETVTFKRQDGTVFDQDIGFRPGQTITALQKLKPIFDREAGTITAGNSCPLTDGAAALVLMTAEKAASEGIEPLGYLHDYAIAGCDPKRMGLGPVYAMHRLLNQTNKKLNEYDLFEINEAFAAQVLACLEALESNPFCLQELGRDALGEIPLEKLNVNGGAIALGHPVGTTGTRLILTLLRALREKDLQMGIASLCVGGGQGAAIHIERTWKE